MVLWPQVALVPSTGFGEQLLCLGVLMIVLDTTIVNVALPSIRADLGFSETSLVWVVNAYMLTFGGFLLLGDAAPPLVVQIGLALIWVAAVLTLVTGYDYLRTGLRHMGGENPS